MPVLDTRPEVCVNMAMSVDGRISTRRREHITLGSRHDRYLMDKLRARADAVIIGAGTLRHDGFPIRVRDDALRAKRVAKGLPMHPLNVVLSRSLTLPVTRDFFSHQETDRLVFTTREAPAARVRRVSRRAEVIILKGKSLSPRSVLARLYARGVRRVVLEGGGEIHWAFEKAGVVDELYITVTPRLIGGRDAPTILDGTGFLKKTHRLLDLMSCRRVGNEIFLHYRVR